MNERCDFSYLVIWFIYTTSYEHITGKGGHIIHVNVMGYWANPSRHVLCRTEEREKKNLFEEERMQCTERRWEHTWTRVTGWGEYLFRVLSFIVTVSDTFYRHTHTSS